MHLDSLLRASVILDVDVTLLVVFLYLLHDRFVVFSFVCFMNTHAIATEEYVHKSRIDERQQGWISRTYLSRNHQPETCGCLRICLKAKHTI